MSDRWRQACIAAARCVKWISEGYRVYTDLTLQWLSASNLARDDSRFESLPSAAGCQEESTDDEK